jgi:hypothetical protein
MINSLSLNEKLADSLAPKMQMWIQEMELKVFSHDKETGFTFATRMIECSVGSLLSSQGSLLKAVLESLESMLSKANFRVIDAHLKELDQLVGIKDADFMKTYMSKLTEVAESNTFAFIDKLPTMHDRIKALIQIWRIAKPEGIEGLKRWFYDLIFKCVEADDDIELVGSPIPPEVFFIEETKKNRQVLSYCLECLYLKLKQRIENWDENLSLIQNLAEYFNRLYLFTIPEVDEFANRLLETLKKKVFEEDLKKISPNKIIVSKKLSAFCNQLHCLFNQFERNLLDKTMQKQLKNARGKVFNDLIELITESQLEEQVKSHYLALVLQIYAISRDLSAEYFSRFYWFDLDPEAIKKAFTVWVQGCEEKDAELSRRLKAAPLPPDLKAEILTIIS